MKSVGAIVLFGALVVIATGEASAQSPSQPQSSFMALLKSGYEVRATSVVPLVEQRQAPGVSNYSPILVTLQKGPSVAVCQFAWNFWANMSAAALENPKLCDVR